MQSVELLRIGFVAVFVAVVFVVIVIAFLLRAVLVVVFGVSLAAFVFVRVFLKLVEGRGEVDGLFA